MWKKGIECILSKFAKDATLSREANTLKGKDSLQDDLGRLETLADRTLVKFDKILRKWKPNPWAYHKLWPPRLGSSSMARGLQVPVNKVSKNEQCAAAIRQAVRMLSCTTSRDKEIIIPHYSVLVRQHLEYCVQFQPPLHKKYMGRLERVQRRVTKINTELGYLLPQENLGEVCSDLGKGVLGDPMWHSFTRSHRENISSNR